MAGVMLGFVPKVALVDVQTELNNKSYEVGLYMQMWSNFERDQKEREWSECLPCENYSVPEEETYEQETVEEMAEEAPATGTGDVHVDVQNEQEGHPEDKTNSDAIPEPPVETEAESRTVSSTPLYKVGNAVLDEGVQTYLYQKLCEAGIGWFFPYAILIAYGESHFDPTVTNEKNGIDKGLFQFRSTYWGAGDIFNPYTQVDVFTGLMANRANNLGCTVSDMISRHNVSDYGPYNQGYVDYIMKEAENLVQIR